MMNDKTKKKWEEIGSSGSYPDGELILKTVGEKNILILRKGENWYAFENKCPHMERPLDTSKIKGTTIECKWHNMIFSLKSGKVLFDSGFMGIPDLTTHEIKIENNMVYISVKAFSPFKHKP